MNKVPLVELRHTTLQIVDGDRGANYPSKTEFRKDGFCVFLNTNNVTRSGFDFSKVDFITQERDELLRKGKARVNDIILTTRGTVGNAAFYGHDVPYKNIRINSGMLLLRADQKTIEPYYLYAFLRSFVFRKQVISNGSGSAQPQLPITALLNISLPLPTFGEQRRIAAVLSALDAKIDLNNRINAELEALAKTIYDYWFVQFDFPDAHGRPYKSSGGAMVWNDTLKREIPAGWEADSVRSVAELGGGGTPSKSIDDFWNGDIPFFSPVDAVDGMFQFDTTDHITPAGLGGCSSPAYPTGTIFVTARGSVGKVVIAGRSMAMNQSCYALRPKAEAFLPFLYFHARTLVEHLKVKASGSTFNSIVTNDIDWTNLVSPPKSLIEKFHKSVRPMFDRIAVATLENIELTQLRDWLLPLLMNGQVRVA